MVLRACFDVKRIAVIGAGPCGLAAAKYLVAQKAFAEVVVFEQAAEVGGVWNYSKNPSSTLHVPQTSPSCAPDPPVFPDKGGPAVFPSPMYDLLHTNIPRTIMGFKDLDFPESVAFPHRDEVQAYLVKYSQDVRHLIKFSTIVRDVRLRQETGKEQWDVKTESSTGGKSQLETFDAVVVASGHYSTTYMPRIPNIEDFHKAHPAVITHSKTYRSPNIYSGKKVIVVGNSASGVDIAAQIQRVAGQVFLSVREPTASDSLAHIGAEETPPISEFLVKEKGVRFEDGRVEKGIDAVVFCTGYLFAFPFLESLDTPLLTDGRRVHGLYKDFLHIKHPTLVFPGLPIKVIPFPFSESQAAIYARLWANVLPLPSEKEMREWEKSAEEQRGPAFHVYPKKGDVEYLREMHAWAARAESGKEPPLWTDEQVWQREIYAQAKLEFEKTGRTAKTLAELGFHYKAPSGAVDEAAQDVL
ncbi:hypothetical protein PspLS_08834 [Pyricularia sp. CBS 133598]|nr:hypothetical protein PspLS_08834 [Pyricularia sp. CBS 133598]